MVGALFSHCLDILRNLFPEGVLANGALREIGHSESCRTREVGRQRNVEGARPWAPSDTYVETFYSNDSRLVEHES